jgi:hypothetical protein
LFGGGGVNKMELLIKESVGFKLGKNKNRIESGLEVFLGLLYF